MNLILCSKKCLYQKEGYCTKDLATFPSKNPTEGCIYYEEPAQLPKKPPLSADEFAGL